MNKLLVFVGILCCAHAVFASDFYETGRPVVSLFTTGGFVPISYNYNQIPEIKIWEDGSIIFSTYNEGKRQSLLARVSPDEIVPLSDEIKAKGFMQFKDSYTGDNAPTDLPSTCIKFWPSETENKQVCDYYNGAPEYFQQLITRLRNFKDIVKSKTTPFYPVAGYVKAYPETCRSKCESTAMKYDGPKITSEGVWITDLKTIATLWDAANSNQLLTDCPNHYFRISVQVDDLSIAEPPKMIVTTLPKTTYGQSTLVIRFVALGLSGLMFLLGMILLIRIIKRRKQMQKAALERDDEVPMVETPSHAAATSSSIYEQPAPQYIASQWAGAPAYANTNPQYIVYYMQPTQTQQ